MNQTQSMTRRGFVAVAAVGVAGLSTREVVKQKSAATASVGLQLDAVTSETFSKYRGTRFLIRGDSMSGAEFDLIDVSESSRRKPKGRGLASRSPFSIVFRGPVHCELRQGTYQVEHESLGTFELFLVPVGPKRDTYRLEAVFA